MSPPAAPTDRPRDPWRRFGWLVWAGWLVFLVFPLGESVATGEPWRITVGVLGTVVFGTLYATALWRDGVGRAQESSRWSHPRALAAMTAIAVLTSVGIGLGAVSFVPFLIAFGTFALPRPLNWWWSASCVLAAVAIPLALDPSFGWLFVIFVSVAVALGTGSGRVMADEGEQHLRVSEQLAITAERDRVARDVHDVLGHSLTVVALKAQLAERLVETDPERARAELAEVQELAREALAEIRVTVRGLRSAGLEDEVAAAGAALAAAGIAAELPTDCSVLDPRRRTVAAWALREAVTNVVRHAGASRCRVELGPSSLSVADDGLGTGAAPAGGGLRGLRERVESSGGKLAVATLPTGGTRLRVDW